MFNLGKAKHYWPIGEPVEEGLIDKGVKGVQGVLWRLFSMGPRLYRNADIAEGFWQRLKPEYWTGDDIFLGQRLRRDLAVVRGGSILDTGVSDDDIALTALAAASYALSGRQVHIIKEGLAASEEDMQKIIQYFKLLDIDFMNIEQTIGEDIAFTASVLCIPLEMVMKEYLIGTDKFGSPRQINQLRSAAFKIDRWQQNGWRLQGLDVVLFPSATDYLVERPEWSAVHAASREDKWENRQIQQLVHVVERDEYQGLAEAEDMDPELVEGIRASVGPLKYSWCNDQVLWGWAKRVAIVCHIWKEGRDYKIEDGLVVTMSPQHKDLIRIAAIRHQLARPVKMQPLSRITLHRFLLSYCDMVLWGKGVSAFSVPLWRMFRRPVVSQEMYIPPELHLCADIKTLGQKVLALYGAAGRSGQEAYLMENSILPREGELAAIPILKNVQAPSGSLVVFVGDVLDPRLVPSVQTGSVARVVHLMTVEQLASLLGPGMITDIICARAGTLSAMSRKLLYLWLKARWMRAKFSIKQLLVDQERRMVQAMDVSASKSKF